MGECTCGRKRGETEQTQEAIRLYISAPFFDSNHLWNFPAISIGPIQSGAMQEADAHAGATRAGRWRRRLAPAAAQAAERASSQGAAVAAEADLQPPPTLTPERKPFCGICAWRRARIISSDDEQGMGDWCDSDDPSILRGLHADPGPTWRAIINTYTLSCPTLYRREDGKDWARIPLRIQIKNLYLAESDNGWEYCGILQRPGDSVIAYHNTPLKSLVEPTLAWTGEPIGNGILVDERLRFGICTHGGCSGVNLYSDGGLQTFHSLTTPGWVQLEVACCNTTKLKGGGCGKRYCIRGPGFATCDKAVLRALWVPLRELPSLVWLS